MVQSSKPAEKQMQDGKIIVCLPSGNKIKKGEAPN